MAATLAGARLTSQHRSAQVALRAITLRQVLQVWPAFDPEHATRSWPLVENALLAIIGQRRADSASLAAGYFDAFREAERIGGKATPPWRWKGRIDGIQAEVTQAAAPSAPKPAAATAPKIAGEPILMPFGDLTVDSGKLVRWTVAAGDRVKKGQTVAEIETDKAVVEIEAPADGVVTQTITETGTVVKMGGMIGAVT